MHLSAQKMWKLEEKLPAMIIEMEERLWELRIDACQQWSKEDVLARINQQVRAHL